MYQKFENKRICVFFTVLRVSRELCSAKPVRKRKMSNGRGSKRRETDQIVTAASA